MGATTPGRTEITELRRYLLGQLTQEEEEQVEVRLLSDAAYAKEFDIVVDEITDQYVRGELQGSERRQAKEYFLKSDERKDKLRFAMALDRHKKILRPQPWWKLKRHLAIAASILIALGAGLGIWRLFFHQSDLDKGLVALNAAYRDQRPIESRISALNYAPFSPTRGPEKEIGNQDELRLAELTLIGAVSKRPTPALHHALGQVYLAQTRFDSAINEFEEALKTDPNNAKLLSDLAAAWMEKGEIDRAQANPNPIDQARGKAFEELGRGLEYLNRALGLDSNLLEAHFNRALILQHMMLSQQAEEAWKSYLEKDSASSWAEEARKNLLTLQEQKTRTSQTKERIFQDFLLAYNAHDGGAAWAALSHSQSRAGNTVVDALLDDYLNLATGAQTVAASEQLQKIVYAGDIEQQKSGDRFISDIARLYGHTSPKQREALSRARSEMKAANERFNRGEFEQAIDIYSQARDLFTQNGAVPEVLFAEGWIGYSRLRLPKFEESIQLFQELSSKFESRGYKSLLAQSLHALADVYLSHNEYSKALDYGDRGLKVSEDIGDEATAIRCLVLGLSTHLILGDYRQSLDSFDHAVGLANAIPPEPKLTWPLYHEAALAFHFLALPASALAFEREALRLAEASGVPLLRSRSWERLGVIYGQQKKHDEAIESGEKALAEARNIAGELSRKNVEARAMLILGELNRDAGNLRKALDYFDQSLALYKELNFDTYSYRGNKGKLLSLIALNEDDAARLELNTVLKLFEDNRKKIIEEGNRDRFFDAGQDTYDIAIGFTASRTRDAIQALQYAEASRARSLFEMMSTGVKVIETNQGVDLKLATESTPLTVSQIQLNMPAEAQLLEYAVLDDEVLMWVITKSAVRSGRSSISGKDLERKVRYFVRLLSVDGGVDHEALLNQAKELHDILIAPVERFLDAKLELCIVADKSLNYLPFGALTSSVGRYLIEDYVLETAPSATVYINCSKEAEKRGKVAREQLLIVGNPRFDRLAFPGLSDLPGALREARESAGFYASPTVLVEGDASEQRVTRELKGADVIHFATHAIADERSPLLSKLILASDGAAHHAMNTKPGILQASEIYEIKLPRTRLVVLSACQTGVEQTFRGEGAVGLARPFLADGVPLVVATLWPVESDATAELMLNFHRYRKKEGMSTAAALQRAQLSMIHDPQSASKGSYVWAAFVTIGGYAAF
jgi:CHAT domain-containing protein